MRSLERLKIMGADDNAHMIHIVETLLRSFGCTEVLSARDPGDAFDRLRHDFADIIIVDYQTEILDGIDFIKLVHNSADSQCRYVPTIMLTARSDRLRVTAARDAGVTEFCRKPVTAKRYSARFRPSSITRGHSSRYLLISVRIAVAKLILATMGLSGARPIRWTCELAAWGLRHFHSLTQNLLMVAKFGIWNGRKVPPSFPVLAVVVSPP